MYLHVSKIGCQVIGMAIYTEAIYHTPSSSITDHDGICIIVYIYIFHEGICIYIPCWHMRQKSNKTHHYAVPTILVKATSIRFRDRGIKNNKLYDNKFQTKPRISFLSIKNITWLSFFINFRI